MTDYTGSLIGRIIDRIDADVINNGTSAVSRDFMRHWQAMSGDIAKAAIAAMGDASTRKDEELSRPEPSTSPVIPSEISLLTQMEAIWKKENEVYKKTPSSYNEGWVDGYEEAIQMVERYWQSYIPSTKPVMGDLEQRVIDAACKVVQADTYKHPILSRQDAVKEGVSELHDAVNAYHSAQPAKAVGVAHVD